LFVNGKYDKLEGHFGSYKNKEEYGLAVINGKIYGAGGYLHCLCTNEVSVYSLDDNKSSLVAPMNFRRVGHGCCAHAGALYVCGGKDGKPSNCCEKLIIKDDKWKFVAKMNIARINFQVVSCGKLIWAIGGGNFNGTLNTTEYFDDINNKWTNSTPMIERREDHSAVAFREKIYIIGGYSYMYGRLNFSRFAEVLDSKTKQFTAIMNPNVRRFQFAAAISEHKLYCFGGDRADTVESFDLYKEEWLEEGRMPKYLSSCRTSAVTIFDDEK